MFLPVRLQRELDAHIVLHPKPNRNTKRNNPRPVAYSLQLSRVISFQRWVPSVVNLAFFGFGETLVHWTHSFLYLHNSAAFPVLQDGMIHKNEWQKLEKLRMDMGLQIWYTKYVGLQTGIAFLRFPFAPQHIQCIIFEAPCPFSVSPTFTAHSCVSSHLAKQRKLRYYEGTKKE